MNEFSLQNGKKRSIKKLVAAGVLLVVVVIVGVLVFRQITKPNEMVSESGDIKVSAISQGMVLKNGHALSGAYKPKEGATLYYIVSSQEDKRVLGAGNILTEKGEHFSRNLTFDAKDYKGRKGQLIVYLQDDKGNRLDSVETEIVFE